MYCKFNAKFQCIPERPKQDSYDPCSKQDLHLVLCSIIELQAQKCHFFLFGYGKEQKEKPTDTSSHIIA